MGVSWKNVDAVYDLLSFSDHHSGEQLKNERDSGQRTELIVGITLIWIRPFGIGITVIWSPKTLIVFYSK